MLTAGIDFVSDKKSIGIAVSGGADSVSLLVSLSHLSKEFNDIVFNEFKKLY